jgi:hypothetical protein
MPVAPAKCKKLEPCLQKHAEKLVLALQWTCETDLVNAEVGFLMSN